MNPIIKRIFVSLSLAVVVGFLAWMFIIVRPIGVEVATIQHNVPVQVFGLGTVEARVLSRVGFEVSGTLVALKVDHGDRIAKGAVLAQLDSAKQQARVTKAEAGLAVAKVQVERARAVLTQRQATYRRQQALFKQGNISREVADEAKTNAIVAQAEVTVAEVAVRDAEAQLKLEQALLQQHTLVSPYEAVVVARHKELGTVLNPGEPLFTLVQPDSIWALGHVDEAQAGNIRVGQLAEVRLRSLPRQAIPAHVVRIGIESDRVSEERQVYVKCNQCPEEFHLGEQAEIIVTVATLDNALLIPQVAVDRYDGIHGIVWTVVEGELQRRKVQFGHRTLDGLLELTSDLAEDTFIVTQRQPGLREGRSVNLIKKNK